MRLAGKVALISGAARGMGAAEALMFAREGAQVVIGDVLEAEGRGVEADIKAKGGEAVFTRLDVTSESDWQEAVGGSEEHTAELESRVNIVCRPLPEAKQSINSAPGKVSNLITEPHLLARVLLSSLRSPHPAHAPATDYTSRRMLLHHARRRTSDNRARIRD